MDILPPHRSRHTAPLSEIELGRAASRWGKFTSGLTEKDREVLDRVAAGESLKAVCFELNLGYEAVQKRMTRWQQSLAVKSTGVMLQVWATVRGFGTRAEDPTLVRYADLLRRTLGYDAPTHLPPADIAASKTARFALGPAKSAASNARELAEQNTLALISPALWRICLALARDGVYDQSMATGLPALHEWFRRYVIAVDETAKTDRLASILSDLFGRGESNRSLLAEDVAILVASQALSSESLDIPVLQPLLSSHGIASWFSSRRACDSKFWRDFVRAAGDRDVLALTSIWQQPQRDLLLDPAYGFAAAVTFFRARNADLRATVSVVLNLILSTRQHWAAAHRLEPTRVLHRQACFECGMSVVETPTPGTASSPVLTAEQLLPSVKRLAVYAA